VGSKNWFFVIPLVVVAALISGAALLVALDRRATIEKSQHIVGKSLLPVKMLTLFGENQELTTFVSSNAAANKKTILVFWATWCEPCLKELPLLKKNLERSRAESVEYIFINYDNGNPEVVLKDVKAWMISQGLDFIPLFFDFKDELSAQVGMVALPFSAGIDETGKIAWAHVGELDFSRELIFNQN
jgi:thiol-disulfide isomerase/thioredoxin